MGHVYSTALKDKHPHLLFGDKLHNCNSTLIRWYLVDLIWSVGYNTDKDCHAYAASKRLVCSCSCSRVCVCVCLHKWLPFMLLSAFRLVTMMRQKNRNISVLLYRKWPSLRTRGS